MKKTIAGLLVLVLICSLLGCGNTTPTPTTAPSTMPTTVPATPPTTQATEPSATNTYTQAALPLRDAQNLKVELTTKKSIVALGGTFSSVSEQELVLFGHPGHPELEGVVGHAGTEKIFVVRSAAEVEQLPELRSPVLLVQTTLSHFEAEAVKKALKTRFPNADIPGNICRASLLRQQAVERLAPMCDLFVVAGSSHSSNANRLRETAERCGVKALLIDSPAEVTPELLGEAKIIGLSAAASTPESQIEALRKALAEC